MIRDLYNKKTKIDNDTFIADSADVMGDVTIGKNSSIWYNVTVRGDLSYISIGEMTNIQDNAVVHVDDNEPCIIGDNVSVGHNAVVHGCTVEDNCLVGMGSIVLNGAVIGKGSMIAAGAVVLENAVIPPNSLVVGIPGKVVRELTEDEINKNIWNAERYEKLWRNEHI